MATPLLFSVSESLIIGCSFLQVLQYLDTGGSGSLSLRPPSVSLTFYFFRLKLREFPFLILMFCVSNSNESADLIMKSSLCKGAAISNTRIYKARG